MKPIEKSQRFENTTLLENFWEVRQTTIKPIHGEKIVQMGFGDEYVKNTVKKMIDEAEETVFLATFLLSDDLVISSLADASERGVRVYILTSNEALLEKERKSDPQEHEKEVVDHHKKVLRTISRTCLVRGSPHLHAKFVVCDPQTKPKGILLTSNVTKEALTRNPELGYILDRQEVEELFEAYRHAFWGEADHELKTQKWAAINNKQVSLNHLDRVVSTINGRNNLENELIKLVQQSSGDLFIGSYKISKDTSLFKAIQSYAERNRVVLFTRLHSANRPVYELLSQNANVTLISSRFLHAKFIMTKSGGIITTANFNEQGFSDGFEVGIRVQNVDEGLKIMKNWTDNLEGVHISRKRISDIGTDQIQRLDQASNKYKTYTIKDHETDSEVINCSSMDDFLQKQNQQVSSPEFKYQKSITKNLTIHPPKVPKRATQIKEKSQIKSSRLLDTIEDLFDRRGKAKYDLWVAGDKLYLKVSSIKEYEKIKSATPSGVRICV